MPKFSFQCQPERCYSPGMIPSYHSVLSSGLESSYIRVICRAIAVYGFLWISSDVHSIPNYNTKAHLMTVAWRTPEWIFYRQFEVTCITLVYSMVISSCVSLPVILCHVLLPLIFSVFVLPLSIFVLIPAHTNTCWCKNDKSHIL